ncbi:hypothetical protein [Fusibacter sp. JL216-2]|uniref:hypothetical protein n=1 Tax=Fusibacter sp. JL216-2 TaxID=3071453 RepID=UPI003D33768F
MTELLSCVLCDEVQELDEGMFNYIRARNVFFEMGPTYFELVLNYKSLDEEIDEHVTITAPSGTELADVHEKFEQNSYYFTSIHEVEVDLDEIGEYKVTVVTNRKKYKYSFDVSLEQ